MELRTVDPATLAIDPSNPRRTPAAKDADDQLAANIKAIGLIQPPLVREQDGSLAVIAGNRRVRAAIAAGLTEIQVLVHDDSPERNQLRALSENVVRAQMNPVDQWRAIEALASANWTEDAIAAALALPVRTIKKLRLLARIHPAMLDQIAKGDMPDERNLRAIAAAPHDEQAAVWKQHKPSKQAPQVRWYEIARALSKPHFLASHAKFGEEEARAFGIIWQEDLFAPAGEDGRYTENGSAFLAAQQAWLETHLPKNGTILPLDEYGRPQLPKGAERVWTKPKKTDTIGFSIDQRTGEISETAFHIPPKQPKAGDPQSGEADPASPAEPAAKQRPGMTQKGLAMIGAFRTQALQKALAQDPIEDLTLIGLLTLALAADNVAIRASHRDRNTPAKVLGQIAEGGLLTQDPSTLRQAARNMLSLVLSCEKDHTNSGVPALIAGAAIGAGRHLPNMATEEFLSCLSKDALNKTAAGLNIEPRERAKDTRAAIIEHHGGSTFILPQAQFALTENELTLLQSWAQAYSFDDLDDLETDDDLEDGAGPAGLSQETPNQETGPSAASVRCHDDSAAARESTLNAHDA